jgi:hypothetical protein
MPSVVISQFCRVELPNPKSTTYTENPSFFLENNTPSKSNAQTSLNLKNDAC